MRNVTCINCGDPLDLGSETKELVIGRRFVPAGALQEGWNLIANACGRCNRTKSALEDDISAITMQPTVFGNFAVNDPDLAAEAARKAAAKSRRMGPPVGLSQESLKIRSAYWHTVRSHVLPE